MGFLLGFGFGFGFFVFTLIIISICTKFDHVYIYDDENHVQFLSH